MSGQVLPILAQPVTHEWATPQGFFDALDDEFGFTVDAAADATNHKCPRWFGVDGEALSGLAVSWAGEVVWCNPPYGKYIGEWVRKANEEARAGATVVMLIPARTDTAYWHDSVMRANEIRFVAGRLRFGGTDLDNRKINAPFPSALIVFRPGASVIAPRISSIGRDGK